MWTIFFIKVPTWHGARRALETFIFWFCIDFISKECWWHCSKAHVAFILKRVNIASEGSPSLSVLLGVLLFSLFHMFLVIQGV
jgi:hypothetical protein